MEGGLALVLCHFGICFYGCGKVDDYGQQIVSSDEGLTLETVSFLNL